METSYELIMNIWENDEEVGYYVGQALKENGSESITILAHGVANDWDDARKQVRLAILEVL